MNDVVEMANSENPPPSKGKVPIVAGAKPLGLVPQNLDEVARIARTAVQAGLLGHVRDDENEKAKKLAQASLIVMQGLELALSPMQSFNGIAVINGRTAVWGKLARALIIRAGHKIEERITDKGKDTETHWCKITRGDNGASKEVGFGIEDAKRAGLWSPEKKVKRYNYKERKEELVDNDSPWHRYWPRMLAWRAFGHCATDVCSDALLGMALAEEMQDVERGRAEEDRGALTPEPVAPPPAAEELADEAAALKEATEAPVEPEVKEEAGPDMNAAVATLMDRMAVATDPDELTELVREFNESYDGHIDHGIASTIEGVFEKKLASFESQKKK